MKPLVRRVVVVALAGIFAVALATLLRRHDGSARYAAAKLHAEELCRAYRAEPLHADSNVCRVDAFAPTTAEHMKAARNAREDAVAAFARGDVTAATSHLIDAMADAREMDRRGRGLEASAAGTMVAKVLDLADAHRGVLDKTARLSISANGHLASIDHPLAADRAHRLWELAHDDAANGNDAARADEMAKIDASYTTMESAILANDSARCQAAAKPVGGLETHLCTSLAQTMRTVERADASSLATLGLR